MPGKLVSREDEEKRREKGWEMKEFVVKTCPPAKKNGYGYTCV